jgi:hypothetical protein
VRVRGYVDTNGQDVFAIHTTGGKADDADREYVGTVVLDVTGRPRIHHGPDPNRR